MVFFRKKVQVKPLPGLFLETLTLTPMALGYLAYIHIKGEGAFMTLMPETYYLVGAGVATSLPLLLYVAGANRIRLGTLGTLQYIGPTLGFFIGAFMYNEPLGATKLFSFVLIWLGGCFVSWSALQRYQIRLISCPSVYMKCVP